MMTLGGCPIQWNLKLQTEIALSTTESEYIAYSQIMWELIPLLQLLFKITAAMKLPKIKGVVTVFVDNNGAISTIKITPRTKHIAVKYHFFRSHINEGNDISLSKIDTNLQKADRRVHASEVCGNLQTSVWVVRNVK
jgi:hypothetical protein